MVTHCDPDTWCIFWGLQRAHRAELEALARQLKVALSTMIAVEPDSDEEGWSGLNEDRALVFSLNAYKQRAEQHNGAIVLAGCALLVERTTALGRLATRTRAPSSWWNALKFRALTWMC